MSKENKRRNGKAKLEQRICDITGEIEYKCLECGSWEYDVNTDGQCQPCWFFGLHTEDWNIVIPPTKLEPPKEPNKLNVLVGTTFFIEDDRTQNYYIQEVVGDDVIVAWDFDEGGSITYSIDFVNDMFKEEIWIAIKPPKE